jgi:dTMP kinase
VKTRSPTRRRAPKVPAIIVPQPSQRLWYGNGLPTAKLEDLAGKLIVVEGGDGSGRSTQISRLIEWLEATGHGTKQVGLKHSTLVSEELERAQQGNILSHRTLSLFYATDFADQLENVIVPALKAGFIVLADRYIYTLMARDLVRGLELGWLQNLYGIALQPDAVFYLRVPPEALVQRSLAKYAALDYWESGMDLGLDRDIFNSFLIFQGQMQERFQELASHYQFTFVDGNRTVDEITEELKDRISRVLAGK